MDLDKPVLRVDEVLAVVGCSRAKLSTMRKSGIFPEPTHQLGPRMMAWDTKVVLGWIEAKRRA